MIDLQNVYVWLKAMHIIAVIAWMAGLLYLPRLFIYHCSSPIGSETSETFKVMERRLLKAIMTPAMITAWLAGGALLLLEPAWLQNGWMHAKLTLVVLMSAMHGFQARWLRQFANDCNKRPAKFYRVMNEVPTVLMIGIVILVVVKPF